MQLLVCIFPNEGISPPFNRLPLQEAAGFFQCAIGQGIRDRAGIEVEGV